MSAGPPRFEEWLVEFLRHEIDRSQRLVEGYAKQGDIESTQAHKNMMVAYSNVLWSIENIGDKLPR